MIVLPQYNVSIQIDINLRHPYDSNTLVVKISGPWREPSILRFDPRFPNQPVDGSEEMYRPKWFSHVKPWKIGSKPAVFPAVDAGVPWCGYHFASWCWSQMTWTASSCYSVLTEVALVLPDSEGRSRGIWVFDAERHSFYISSPVIVGEASHQVLLFMSTVVWDSAARSGPHWLTSGVTQNPMCWYRLRTDMTSPKIWPGGSMLMFVAKNLYKYIYISSHIVGIVLAWSKKSDLGGPCWCFVS